MHPWLFLSFSDTSCVSFPELLMRCCNSLRTSLQWFYTNTPAHLPFWKVAQPSTFTLCMFSGFSRKRIFTLEYVILKSINNRQRWWLRITALVLDELLLLEINGFGKILDRTKNLSFRNLVHKGYGWIPKMMLWKRSEPRPKKPGLTFHWILVV